ncbi:peptidoglycan bridge formation glycyltransferase FemA/FemB family protein [Planococcus sp. CAU13]|uniref:peptidoglycan bridge formation glycyltransferase FemA/FemB family protein n=1 Tax=Planococcus sp. CAU13 TaxID=1541197 RepID=UPI000530020D|nr:peptidoglycan bridge formation glycyltransferase FemA/FemB family protein [Planococcus sp. CAU13]
MVDLYFELQYGRLYEKLENGICDVYEFSHRLGTVRHMFIKREIPERIDGQIYYDIVTPYGYGGPMLSGCLPENRQELTREFHAAFSRYCAEEHIVSEFIRFHPVLNNADDFKEIYDVRYMRPTVGTNLLSFDDPVAREFSKTAKKNIRNAIGEGVQHRLIENPDNLDAFKEIYYATMKRKNADDYYFFDDEYFDGLLKTFGNQMLITEASYKNRTIGMALTFKYRNFLHTHLSGTNAEYHHLYPAYVMQFALVRWGKENGFHLLHDGGGLTNSLEDSLYMFKKQFGKHTKFPFQVGRKVWNPEIYWLLCSAAGTETESDFFPAYRDRNTKTVTTA